MDNLDLNPLELKMLEALMLAKLFIDDCPAGLPPIKEIEEAIELAEWVGTTDTVLKIKKYRRRKSKK